MPAKYTISFFLFCLLVNLSVAQNFDQDVKLRDEISKYGQADVVIKYPGREKINSLTRLVSITAVRENNVYISLSPVNSELFLSLKYDYVLLPREESKGVNTAGSVKEASAWESYPAYSDYVQIMQNFQTAYPTLCNLDTIGTSIYGKLVLVLKISDNVNTNEDEPEVFYTSTIHGDELAGFVLMMHLADSLLSGYSTSLPIKNLVDNLEIWINPLSNPDGTYRTGNTLNPTRYNANGVDLNRNYPDPLDLSIVPQKENVDMMKFLRKRRFVLSANFHAGYEVVNYPWDRWYSKFHADDAWFYNISRAYADTVHNYSDPAYMTAENDGVTRGAAWYVIYGGRQDFVTWELQGREVTIELDYVKQTPAAQLGILWRYNRKSFLEYLGNALYGIHGTVRDSETALPVPAKVYISGHDKDSSHVYSDSTSGKFVRMLSPGSWNLTFTAGGYRDTTITGVPVIAFQKTTLLVNMKPVATVIDTTKPASPLLYPNPVKDELNCLLPWAMAGEVVTIITDAAGRKILYRTGVYHPGIPLTIDVTGFAGGLYIITFKNIAKGIRVSSNFVKISGEI